MNQDLHEQLHGEFYSDAHELTTQQLREAQAREGAEEELVVDAHFNDDGLVEAVEHDEVPVSKVGLQPFRDELEQSAERFVDTAETRWAVNTLEPTYSKAFKKVCVHYFDVRCASAVSAFRFSETRGSRREFLPSRSDFIVDVELCGKRALKNAYLLRVWQSFVIGNLGLNVETIPFKAWSILTQRVGVEFCKSKVYPLGQYFGARAKNAPNASASLAEILSSRKRKSGPHASF